jgi:acetyl esterase/lipase
MIRATSVLAATFSGGGPTCEPVRIAGVDAVVARPEHGPGPIVVYVNACTPRGVEQPVVRRLLGGFARAGFIAVAPELPRVKDGEITRETVDALVAVARAAGPRIAFVGASTGAGLAILAAGDPRLADRVTAVAGIAPFASLRNLLLLATTGHYGDRLFAASSLVGRVTARSLEASAPEDPAVAPLLANRDPQRFPALYEQLDARTRAVVDELSPVTRIGDVLAPVELLVSPTDRFFPVEESRALAHAGHDVRLTVTRGLEHVRPRLAPGIVTVIGALDRTLRRAATEEPTADLRPSLAA